MLQADVTQLAGERYSREGGEPDLVRYGNNPGSVPLEGQRVPIRVPRVRDQVKGTEAGLPSLEAIRRATGEVDETPLYRVLHGLSCRDYQGAAEAVPGTVGLSSSSVSREFKRTTATKLRDLQERDLLELDIVAMVIDGKTFADDIMVTALGLTSGGGKVILGFVQADTENAAVLTRFLRELLDRGLKIDEGLVVVIDGS